LWRLIAFVSFIQGCSPSKIERFELCCGLEVSVSDEDARLYQRENPLAGTFIQNLYKLPDGRYAGLTTVRLRDRDLAVSGVLQSENDWSQGTRCRWFLIGTPQSLKITYFDSMQELNKSTGIQLTKEMLLGHYFTSGLCAGMESPPEFSILRNGRHP
jgi:hypothetical protein